MLNDDELSIKKLARCMFLLMWIASLLQNFDPDIKDKAAIYVPSIGKCTIACLLRNMVQLARGASTSNGSI